MCFFPFKGTSKAYNLSKVPKVRPFVPALLSLVFDCDVPSITSLPTQHQEGPLLHGEEIDSAVESVIAGFRRNKAVVNTRIVMAGH